jgi:hypothetical protein
MRVLGSQHPDVYRTFLMSLVYLGRALEDTIDGVVIPVPFSVEGSAMLSHCKWLLEETEEDRLSLIAIHPSFDKLLTANIEEQIMKKLLIIFCCWNIKAIKKGRQNLPATKSSFLG